MAIASLATSAGGLVLTLLCCAFIVAPIVGIVLGVVALNQIKTTGQPGRGLAIAGIVVGALTLLLALILVIAVGAVGLNSPDYSSI
ncbi:hypothetical protein AWB99_22755 [Mycolicibacterium confluentis]|nr:hypothetical protein AWB99_22755 [Mycolicibacterium confluentis]